MMTTSRIVRILATVLVATASICQSSQVAADGMVKGPAQYEDSLEERSQEAVIIVTNAREGGPATEDLILRISVVGAVDHFAWVIPFPNQPTTTKADSKLFKELFDYVEFRLQSKRELKQKMFGGGMGALGGEGVDVLSRLWGPTMWRWCGRTIQGGSTNGLKERATAG